jgi:sulfonate transport system substrate-binding protein
MRFGLRRLLTAAMLTVLVAVPWRPAAAETTLSVAYIPIMPMAQLFVMEGEGWTRPAGLHLALTKFSSGPAMLEAMASGRYDIMYVGIGPALIARARGIPIKVVAANVVDPLALIVRGPLAKDAAAAQTPIEAFRDFIAEERRPPTIATLPKGSVPDLALRYWLMQSGLGVDAASIVGMGADEVEQALITGSVDAASIVEPILTIVQERVPDARILARGDQMFPNLPGAVVAVSETALAHKRSAILSLLRLHIRATQLLRENPAVAARDVAPFIGHGASPATIERAVRSPISQFVSDPRPIVGATGTMNEFAAKIGIAAKPVAIDQLFDLSLYQEAAKPP